MILKSIVLFITFSFALYAQSSTEDTLYNQTLTPSGNLQTSSHFFQNGFETTYSCTGADDFVSTQQWKITKVFALGGFYNGSQNPQTFHTVFYADDNPDGNFPGTELYNYYNTVEADGNGGFTIPIEEDLILTPGHYWVAIYANVATGYATWGWKPSSGNDDYEAGWKNPGDGFGTGYTDWTPITNVFSGTTETDYSFALFGIKGTPASNPDPEDNELAVVLDQNINWSNPSTSDSIEVFFGTDTTSLASTYYGTPITTLDPGMLNYYTNYFWKVVEINDNGRSTGLLWDFTTALDPTLPVYADFEDNIFPPLGWSYEFEDENWWYKGYYSGYGIGEYSAVESFYSAPVGNVSSLVTQTFLPTAEEDSLIFEHAYAINTGGFVDELEILYSVDAGSTWTSLVLLSNELITALPTNNFFVPNADQWGTLKYELPSGVNRLKFTGISANSNNMFLDNIELKRNSIVNVEEHENIPTEFSLSQNYPNPFNPTTTIKYTIREDGNVRLSVVNALGEKVKTVVDDFEKAGNHTIHFSSAELSSGIYYYQLSSGTYSSVKKMIVLK